MAMLRDAALLAVGLAVGSGASGLASQASWTWPDSLDATIAASASHRVLLEDESVRVLVVSIPSRPEGTRSHPSLAQRPRAGARRPANLRRLRAGRQGPPGSAQPHHIAGGRRLSSVASWPRGPARGSESRGVCDARDSSRDSRTPGWSGPRSRRRRGSGHIRALAAASARPRRRSSASAARSLRPGRDRCAEC